MGLSTRRFRADVDVMKIRMEQLTERSEREILQVMREEAAQIAELAKDYAPRDEGSLEDAIKVLEDREGLNRRTRVTVGVDENHLDDKGRRVGEYALIMHEKLAPYGSGAFNLGPESTAKDAGSGRVGGKYLDRAIMARMGAIRRRVQQTYERIFR